MTVSRRDALVAGAAALPVVALAAVASAQVPATRTQPGIAGARGAAGSAQGEDPLLGAMMLFKGRRQIETSKYALSRTENQEVKAFLNSEIQEHETLKGELQTKFGLAYPTPAGSGAAPAGSGTTPAGGMNPTVAVGAVQVNGAAGSILTVKGEVIDQCIANYKKNMAKYTGVKLDKAIIGDQLHEHQGLLDDVLVFQRHSSAAMLPALKTAQSIIEQHIATCEQLMEKLDKQSMNGAGSGSGNNR